MNKKIKKMVKNFESFNDEFFSDMQFDETKFKINKLNLEMESLKKELERYFQKVLKFSSDKIEIDFHNSRFFSFRLVDCPTMGDQFLDISWRAEKVKIRTYNLNANLNDPSEEYVKEGIMAISHLIQNQEDIIMHLNEHFVEFNEILDKKLALISQLED